MELTANVSLNCQALQITQAQAVIRNPDGEIETFDIPAGQNTSVTWTPLTSGTHAVDIVVTALARDGSSIERTDFLAIEVQPGTSKRQITLNLVLVITAVLVVLGLVLLLIFRGTRKLVRKARS